MAQVEESEYKGNAVLVIRNSENDKFPVQIGLRKARMILEHIEDVKRFVTKHKEEAFAA